MNEPALSWFVRLRHWAEDGMRRPSFWAVVAMAGLIFVGGLTYTVNRNAINRHRRRARGAGEDKRAAPALIEYQCRTNFALDIVVKQFLVSGLQTLRTLPPAAQRNYRVQLTTLQTLHLFLADTRACKDVTG